MAVHKISNLIKIGREICNKIHSLTNEKVFLYVEL